MSVSETDSEVSARLEFEQAQRSEGWKLLRGLLRDQRRNLLIGGLIGISWAAFKVAIPQVTKFAINDGIEKNGPLFSRAFFLGFAVMSRFAKAAGPKHFYANVFSVMFWV
jgi:hypothetical protein